jgi:hypothetical protein
LSWLLQAILHFIKLHRGTALVHPKYTNYF